MHLNKPEQLSKDQFIYSKSKYYGECTPEQLAFNANLQEFAQRVGYICSLETGGKLSSMQAYYGIKRAWKQLKRSKKELGIGKQELPEEDFTI